MAPTFRRSPPSASAKEPANRLQPVEPAMLFFAESKVRCAGWPCGEATAGVAPSVTSFQSTPVSPRRRGLRTRRPSAAALLDEDLELRRSAPGDHRIGRLRRKERLAVRHDLRAHDVAAAGDDVGCGVGQLERDRHLFARGRHGRLGDAPGRGLRLRDVVEPHLDRGVRRQGDALAVGDRAGDLRLRRGLVRARSGGANGAGGEKAEQTREQCGASGHGVLLVNTACALTAFPASAPGRCRTRRASPTRSRWR